MRYVDHHTPSSQTPSRTKNTHEPDSRQKLGVEITQRMFHMRQKMLERVHTTWIKGVLEPSLSEGMVSYQFRHRLLLDYFASLKAIPGSMDQSHSALP